MTNLLKQFLLIGIAGDAILTSFGSELSKQTMEHLCFNEYWDLVDQFMHGNLLYFPNKPSWLTNDHFLHLNTNLLDGALVWYLFQSSRRYVTCQINPLFRRLEVGESFLDLCFEIRDKLWNKKHLILRSRNKSRNLIPLPPFDEEWEPNEWFLFLYCGVNGIVTNCFSEVVLSDVDACETA